MTGVGKKLPKMPSLQRISMEQAAHKRARLSSLDKDPKSPEYTNKVSNSQLIERHLNKGAHTRQQSTVSQISSIGSSDVKYKSLESRYKEEFA